MELIVLGDHRDSPQPWIPYYVVVLVNFRKKQERKRFRSMIEKSFIKYILSNTFYQIHFTKYILGNTF